MRRDRVSLAFLLRTGIAALAVCAPMSHANIAPQATAVTEILDLRVGLTPGRTRIVFDLSDAAAYTLLPQDDPARVVVTIPAANSAFNPDTLSLRGTPIDRIGVTRLADASMRYEFELIAGIETKLFALKPGNGYGHRLVLDLYLPPNQADTYDSNAPADVSPATQLAAVQPAPRTLRKRNPQNATKIPNPVDSGSSGEWSGSVSLQTRLFFNDPAFPKQDDQNISAAFEPEYFLDWANGDQSVAFRGFGRYDANDDRRTHADIRELYWRGEYEKIVVKVGVDVVFWGVTESQHMVDIINQTDWVEDIDGEEKLGQPMLNMDYLSQDWGTWQAYILPYFRDRTYPGEHGRLRNQPVVDKGSAIYESGDERKHVDFALRWSHYIGDWDIGVSHFSGTSRDPILLPSGTPQKPTIVPLYIQIDQTSLDVQATKGAWLWKLEALYNDNSVEDYYATVGGFEYTHFGLLDTPNDLGWLLEYHYDERDENALSNLQNDLYAGVRLTGNDIASTRLLVGVIFDLDTNSTIGNVEAVRRLGESWTLSLEARFFNDVDDDNPLYSIKQDDYIELELSRFF